MTKDENNYDGTAEIPKILRSMIEHENILLNNRISWALTTQGFLIAVAGVIWEKSLNNEYKVIITLIAILVIVLLISFWYTITFNRKAIEDLLCEKKSLGNKGRCKEENKYKYFPPIIGNYEEHNGFMGIFRIFLIWNALPIFLIIFWTAIIFLI